MIPKSRGLRGDLASGGAPPHTHTTITTLRASPSNNSARVDCWLVLVGVGAGLYGSGPFT
jgi:hypothetical protein